MENSKEKIKITPMIYPLVIVFSLMFIVAYGAKLLLDNNNLSSQGLLLFALLYMWLPSITVLYFVKKEKISIPFFSRNSHGWLLAFILPIAIIFSTLLVSAPFGSFEIETCFKYIPDYFYSFFVNPLSIFTSFLAAVILYGLLCGVTVDLVFYYGSEILWRGYLHEKLSHFGFWKSSIIIGILWGLSQAPIVWFFHVPLLPPLYIRIIFQIIFCLLITPIMSYLRIRSGSILYPAIFYSTLNALSKFPSLFFMDAAPIWIGVNSICGFIVLIIFNLLLFTKRQKKALA